MNVFWTILSMCSEGQFHKDVIVASSGPARGDSSDFTFHFPWPWLCCGFVLE